MRFRVLGPLEIERDGESVRLTSHRQRAVLAMLLLAAGRSVSAERLIEAVWGEDLPANPTNTLQHSVAQIRKALEPARARSEPPTTVLSSEGGYRLAITDHELDAAQFEVALESAKAQLNGDEPSTAADTITAALALWRGAAYTDFDDDGFADGERQRLAEQHRTARELLVDARMAAVGPQSVVAELEALVAEYPHREGLWARLMTALYQAGRQAEALRAYQRLSSRLGEDLGLLPSPELQALEQQILVQDPDLSPTTIAVPPPAPPANNLPAPTGALIGRENELRDLLAAVASSRLVTLLGPGGSGKTRLALEAARLLSVEPTPGVGADGLWLVRLDDLSDHSLLAPSIGTALRMPESGVHEVAETLVAHLGSSRTLLILDNCEHLLDAISDLAHLLITSCPELVILATSQAPLRLGGERRVVVPPLALPGAEGSPFVDLETSPAVRLFIERATGLGVEPELLAAERNAIVNIVQALDGLPLAIELAAARTDLLTPTEIAQMLADRFELLTDGPRDAPQRQRTLGNTMAWSHDLLDGEEQDFFGAISVFSGGFDAKAAAAITRSDEPAALALIGRLVTRSLLTREAISGGPSRFRQLESLRQFGLQQLASGRSTVLRQRHAALYAERAEHLDRLLSGSEQATAFASFIADEDNMRTAMAWSLEAGATDPEQWTAAARIGARSGKFWDWRGSLAEANTWLGRIADVVTAEHIADLPIALSWQGYFLNELGDLDRAQALSDRAHELARAQGDLYAESIVESGHAMYARLRGDPATAIEAAARLRAISTSSNDHWGTAWTHNHDALAHLAIGDHDAAAEAGERSRVGFRAIGDRRATGWALTVLAQIALERGQHELARAKAREALELSVEAGDGRNAAWAAELEAAATRAAGDEDGAKRLEGEAAELLAVRGMQRSPWHRS